MKNVRNHSPGRFLIERWSNVYRNSHKHIQYNITFVVSFEDLHSETCVITVLQSS